MSDDFLTRVYNVRTAEETRALYDEWSASYETEVSAQGYATPGRVAEALRAQMQDVTLPILDFGCGTGLSGLALRLAGFTVIDGADLSADMLACAQEKHVYRTLTRIEPDDPAPGTPGDYAAITAIGVIGAGAAPIETFDTLMNALGPGGYLAFSFNDHALADPHYEGKLNEYLDTGAARLLVREYGDHLPGIGLNANVYVVEKT